MPNSSTFGFHGLFNMWRHCSDEEIIDIVRKLQFHTISSREFTELTIIYFQLRKFNVLEEMYLRMKESKNKNLNNQLSIKIMIKEKHKNKSLLRALLKVTKL